MLSLSNPVKAICTHHSTFQNIFKYMAAVNFIVFILFHSTEDLPVNDSCKIASCIPNKQK